MTNRKKLRKILPFFYSVGVVSLAVFFISIVLFSKSSDASDDYNDEDIVFVQHMIPHHEQAVEMVAILLTQGESPEVAQIGEQIGRQYAEIQLLQSWLFRMTKSNRRQQDDLRIRSDHTLDNTRHSEIQHFGMVLPEQMEELKQSTGIKTDRLFLKYMIAHHEGAVVMAEKEQVIGQNNQIQVFAGNVILIQKQEIEEMYRLYSRYDESDLDADLSNT